MSPVPPIPEASLTWRALHLGDLESLYALLRRIEEHDDPPYRSTREEVNDSAQSQWQNLEENSLAGFDADGVLRAYGVVTEPEGPAQSSSMLDGGVDPIARNRGVGTAVLSWQVGRAKELLAGGEDPGRLIVHVDDAMGSSAELVGEHGFIPGSFHTEMRRDLRGADLPEVSLAHPLELVNWTPELDDAIRLAHGEAFGSGQQPPTPLRWQEGRTYFVPEWSFLVLDRTSDRAQVAGYLMCSKYEQDWPTLGWSEGYVDMLGVRAPWRGRRIGTALLVRAMAAFAGDGMEFAALGLDHAAKAESFGLFERLGFAPTRGSTSYVLPV